MERIVEIYTDKIREMMNKLRKKNSIARSWELYDC